MSFYLHLTKCLYNLPSFNHSPLSEIRTARLASKTQDSFPLPPPAFFWCRCFLCLAKGDKTPRLGAGTFSVIFSPKWLHSFLWFHICGLTSLNLHLHPGCSPQLETGVFNWLLDIFIWMCHRRAELNRLTLHSCFFSPLLILKSKRTHNVFLS